MFHQEGKQSHFFMLTGGVLLVAATLWLSWPQSLPKTDLALASSRGALDYEASIEPDMDRLPPVHIEALPEQGDLAFIWNDLLYVAEGGSDTVLAVSDSGRALAPAWSADGEWLAYIRVTDAKTDRGPLWLVRRDGSEAHEVQGLPATLWEGAFTWSPTENQLAVAVHRHGLWLVPTTGKPEQIDPAPWLYQSAWSPDGQYIAYNYCLSGETPQDEGDHDILCVIDIKQRQRYNLVQTDNAGVRVIGWWPDGNGILYWEVPAHGGSVATDGVTIQGVPIGYTNINEQIAVVPAGSEPVGTMLQRADGKGQQPVELITTLCKDHWIDFTSEGKLLAVEGSGRIAWENKQLTIVDTRTGRAERLTNPKGQVALDPCVNKNDGSIAFVAAPDLGHKTWGLTEQEYSDWITKRTLWLRTKDGQLRELTQAGSNVFGPTWSADNKQVHFFAKDALWTVAADNQSPAQKIVELGPCEGNGIYGSIDYNSCFAWYGNDK